MRTPPTNRVITGSVASDGSISAGTGFRPSRTAAGQYRLDLPNVRFIRSAMGNSRGPGLAVQMSVFQPSVILVYPWNTANANVDSPFDFEIVVAPLI